MGLPLSETATDKFSYSAEEQRAARMPSDLLAQVYELRTNVSIAMRVVDNFRT